MNILENHRLYRIGLLMLTVLIAVLGFSLVTLSSEAEPYNHEIGGKIIAEIQENLTDSDQSLLTDSPDQAAVLPSVIVSAPAILAGTVKLYKFLNPNYHTNRPRARSPPLNLPV